MIHINGAEKSGSGTILRQCLTFSSLLGEPVHIFNIRAGRKKPGLRPQHLASVRACAEMCGAEVTGAQVSSMEITFKPKGRVKGGHYQWDIGTAGSTTLLAITLLPLVILSGEETAIRISGGLFQDFAPSALHMQHVLLPTLYRMGTGAELRIVRPGYVPKGGGVIEIKTRPVEGTLEPIRLLEQGSITAINGVALSSRLRERKVSDRMADECLKALARQGLQAGIERLYDDTAFQAGACLAIWAETDTGCLIGSDQAGRPRRSSESIGKYVAKTLIEDTETGATVDRHLADQLIIYGALASGTTEYLVPRMTDHIDANLWLAEKWGARTRLDDARLAIEGLGFKAEGL
jgi:RNA 3'-terminal phosphate cyclase (ATP)